MKVEKKHIIIGIAILVILAGIFTTIKMFNNSSEGGNGNNGTSTEQKTKKEPSEAFKATEPTAESKAAVREQEKQLREQRKKSNEESLTKNNGISNEATLFDISSLVYVNGKEVIDKYLPKDSWELENPTEIRNIEISENKKHQDFEVELILRIKNLVTDYSITDTRNGNIVIYKIDKNGVKSDFEDFSTAKQLLEEESKYAKGLISEIPAELIKENKIKQTVELNFNNKGTDILLNLSSKEKNDLVEALKDVVRIGVEVRGDGLNGFHTEKTKFDYSVPVIIK